MNQDKAKELFSPYYEGTLEPGLAQALGQTLTRDPHLRDEFEQFERTYDELRALKFETIEIPADLAEKIAARIDRQVYEQKRTHQPSWMLWLRNVSLAGVATAALVGAILSLRNGSGDTSQAQLVPGLTSASKDRLVVTPTPIGVRLQFTPVVSESLVIREGLEGAERRRLDLQGDSLSTTLQNLGNTPAAFSISGNKDTNTTLIALPGTSKLTKADGHGNIEEFAKCLAGFYSVPVQVNVASPSVNLSWNFGPVDAEEAASATLDLTRYTVESMPNGLLVITESNG